jgi:hypothetical protein
LTNIPISITNTLFRDNIADEMNGGNDIYIEDVSTYDKSLIINSYSTSYPPQIICSNDIDLSSLLLEEEDITPLVFVAFLGGNDLPTCGSSQTVPCASVEYVFQTFITGNGQIHITDNSDYPVQPRLFDISYSFSLVIDGYGKEISTTPDQYPGLYSADYLVGYWLQLTSSYFNQSITLNKLRLIYAQVLSNYWFTTSSITHLFVIENCYFTRNITNFITHPIFLCVLGSFFFFFFYSLLFFF